MTPVSRFRMHLITRPRDLPGKLLAALLICTGAAIAVLGFRYFTEQSREIEGRAHDTLNAVADLKVAQIRQWREEILGDANWIIQGSLLEGDVRRFFANPADSTARERLTAWLIAWQRYQGCARIRLVDTTGHGLLAAPQDGQGLEARSQEFAARAAREISVLVDDLHLREETPDTVALDIYVPLVGRAGGDGRPAGVLVLEIDPRTFLFPMIETWPTPSLSAETLLVRRDGDAVVFLNELRHRKGTALKLSIPISERHLPAARAVLGETGVVAGLDYRGVPVLSALRPIPDSPWYLVAKQDEAEILAPLRQQAWNTAIVVGSLMLAVLLGLALLWRRREGLFAAQEQAERAATTAKLEESEARFRSLFTSMSEGAVLHDLVREPNGAAVDYRIIELNPAFERHTGISLNTARGTLASALYGVTPPPYLDLYAEVATTGIEKSFDAFFAPLGRHFHVSVFSPGPNRFATIFEDITERKTAEQERESLLADLARANAELESLIYVASHDLRAPLVNLQGFGQRLEKSCGELTELLGAPATPATWHEPVARLLGERIPGALKYIRSSIEKMEALINGLLRVARLGHATLTIERLDMDRLVGEVLTAQGYQIQTVDARVQVAPLPPCLGDAALINQVFANLLDNARLQSPDQSSWCSAKR